MSTLNWEIRHVPPNPPFIPTQQPTVHVYAAVIDPKMANILVRKLNQIAPLETFRHLKRVRKSSIGGKIELSVILCLAGENDDALGTIPKDVLELINCYQLSPFVTQVCRYGATTKEEWQEQSKLWPTSFHPPTYNIEGITGFNEEDSKLVFNYMNIATKLAKSCLSQLTNAVVIVDPSANQIIATACDETSSWSISLDSNESNSSETDEPSTSHDVANGSPSYEINMNCSPNNSNASYIGISCLNPWKWSQQDQHSSGSCFWHPLRHAPMVAIEKSAARDRCLFPNAGNFDEKYDQDIPMENSVVGSPAKRLKRSPNNVESYEDAPTNNFLSKFDRPYLCTGYDVYVAWEPCPMCAMGLLHQRVRRIFYAYPNPSTGALGSVYRLQGEKSLNHHYAVFRVVLPDEQVNGNPEGSAAISSNHHV